jgi:hypothetical protein
MTDGKYHGQAFKPGVEPTAAPPNPADAGKPPAAIRQGITPYGKVVMIGSHGLACAQNQTLSFHDLTLDQVHKLKWQYFGVCGAQVTCYDGAGNVVWQE